MYLLYTLLENDFFEGKMPVTQWNQGLYKFSIL